MRRRSCNSDLQKLEAKYFCFGGLTRFLKSRSDLPDGQKRLIRLGKTDCSRNADELSYPAHAGYPVRRGPSVLSLLSLEYWIARPSAQLRTRRAMTKSQIPPIRQIIDGGGVFALNARISPNGRQQQAGWKR
jgi:hypothetical protein